MKSITCLTCGLALPDEASDCECDTERTLVIIDDDAGGEAVFLGQKGEEPS